MRVTALFAAYRLPLIALAAAALMALAAGGAWQWQANAYSRQIADIRRAYAEAITTAQAQARAEEARRQLAIEGIRTDAKDKIDQASVDAAAADTVADGLRVELARIKRGTAKNPSATAGSPARPNTTAVLADLLAEVERAGRAMAAEATRRGIAGEAAERAYGALSP